MTKTFLINEKKNSVTGKPKTRFNKKDQKRLLDYMEHVRVYRMIRQRSRSPVYHVTPEFLAGLNNNISGGNVYEFGFDRCRSVRK